MIRALIFDFDGLILDTEWPVYQSWLALFEEFGVQLSFDWWASIIGVSSKEHADPMDRLADQVGPLPDREALAERRHQMEIDLVLQQPILPGVVDVLDSARGLDLKLGLASSSSYQWVGGHLQRLGLIEYFQAVHTSDHVERTKPDPALFQLALHSLDLQPAEALVLEDSPNGITAAQRAGIFAVAVPNRLTAQLDLSHADLQLESLAQLPLTDLLKKVQSLKGER